MTPRDNSQNLISVASLFVANVCSTLSAALGISFAAWHLSDTEYSDWVALSTLGLVLSPLLTTFQVAAVRGTVVRQYDLIDHLRNSLLPLTLSTALTAPLGIMVSRLFNLDLISVSLTLLAFPIGLLQSLLFGWLQGKSRFLSILCYALGMATLRPAVVLIAFVTESDPIRRGSLYQAAVGLLLVVVALALVNSPSPSVDRMIPHSEAEEETRDLRIILTLAALTTTDVLVSRLLLADGLSSQFATGSLLAKAIPLLPMAVTSVTFPSMFEAGPNVLPRIKEFAAFLALSAIGTNVGYMVLSKYTNVSVLNLDSKTLFSFNAFGVTTAFLVHIVYKGLAVSAVWTSRCLLSTLGILILFLTVVQPESVLSLVYSYIFAISFGAIAVCIGIYSGRSQSNERD